jgi:hypothetical protein
MSNFYYKRKILGSSGSLVSIKGYYLNEDDYAMIITDDGAYFYRLVDYTGRFVPDDSYPDRVSPISSAQGKKWERISSEPQILGGKGLREDPPNTPNDSFSIWLTNNIS